MKDYNNKYIKYKLKYNNLKNKLNFNLNGGDSTSLMILPQQDKTHNNLNINIILYKANWCTHCINFVNVWEELQNIFNNKINFITYEDTNTEHKKFINKAGIREYPTIQIIINNDYDKPIKYSEKRNLETLTNYINNLIN